MKAFRRNVFAVAAAAAVAGTLAVVAVAVGITSETSGDEGHEPVVYSEPSWTDTSTLIIGGYEAPSPEMIATSLPLSEQ